MLNKLLSLYLQSLVTTTILVGIASCIWIGYRALKKKDKQPSNDKPICMISS